jgi:hypothetical protein
VSWPSQTRRRNLIGELHPLGKALVRGTFSQIANAAYKCKHIRKELVYCVLQDLRKEMVNLCSRKNPSKCRSCSPNYVRNLTVEDICLEWSTRAPIFYSFLMAAGVPSMCRYNDCQNSAKCCCCRFCFVTRTLQGNECFTTSN